VFVRRHRWLGPLIQRVHHHFNQGPRPRIASVVSFLLTDAGFLRACERETTQVKLARRPPAVMHPAPGTPSTWDLPALTTTTALAEWLGLRPTELDWFAALQSRGRKIASGPLAHYHYRWQAKASGSARLIEAPKPRLKALQRKLLDDILDRIPPHESAHGFRPGRSVRTYVEPHVGKHAVLKLDLRHFFASVGFAQVVSVFMTAGYPEAVAQALAGLCTNAVPSDIWKEPTCPLSGTERWHTLQRFRRPHLPQGSPSSPALANLCLYRLDCRLAAYARAAGAHYTRYADDLVFSGDREFAKSIKRFHVHVCALVMEEGFAVQPRKTRVMRRGVRQRVAGVVINEVPNIARDEYDILKATLHNCVRFGPQDQNRSGHAGFRSHLAGRISHIILLNPARGQRLRDLFEQIAW